MPKKDVDLDNPQFDLFAYPEGSAEKAPEKSGQNDETGGSFGASKTTPKKPAKKKKSSRKKPDKKKNETLTIAMDGSSPEAVDLENRDGTEFSNKEKIWSVWDLSQEIKKNLKDRFYSITLQAEIADFKGIHRSGHLYFALKDEKAQIRAVMWRGAVQKVPFKIEQGLELIVRGKLDFYHGSGSLQVVVEAMEPVGIGSLQLKFEQLKEKLKTEGLFEMARKRPFSIEHGRIGIVTGRSTAALQDLLKVLHHRYPLIEAYVFPASVQGEKAPAEIVAAIHKANQFSQKKKLDLLIVGRGGGSYEDLFCFNEEAVARAIVGSELPVITGIGHEIDVTIADMVADHRAATPSHAAAEAVPDILSLQERLNNYQICFCDFLENLIQDKRQELDQLYNRLLQAAPHKKIKVFQEQLEQLRSRICFSMDQDLKEHRTRIQSLASLMDALSPLKVLDRGYSLVRQKGGSLIKDEKQVDRGAELEIRLAKGTLEAKVL